MAYLSRSAPSRGRDDDLASHLPDDLFEEAPSMEQALCAAPSARGITVADLEVVRECAGLAGASEALRSGNFLAERYHDEHAPALARGGDNEWIEKVDRRLSVLHAFTAIGAQASELWRR